MPGHRPRVGDLPAASHPACPSAAPARSRGRDVRACRARPGRTRGAVLRGNAAQREPQTPPLLFLLITELHTYRAATRGQAFPFPPQSPEISCQVVGIRDVAYSVYEWRLRRSLTGRPIPRHVAVMLDGNRRWARAAGFTDVSEGHLAGAKRIADLLDWCAEMGVEHVTLWLLSTDNLTRPPDQLDPLLRIIEGVAAELSAPAKPWRITPVGALDLLPEATANALKAAAEATARRDGLMVNMAGGDGGGSGGAHA